MISSFTQPILWPDDWRGTALFAGKVPLVEEWLFVRRGAPTDESFGAICGVLVE